MVHKFFEEIAKQPHLLRLTGVEQDFLLKGSATKRFCKVFSVLFPESGIHGENLASWLNIISSRFVFNEERVNAIYREGLEALFLTLGCNPRTPNNTHVFQFFLYLIYMYELLTKDNYAREDHIFAFFNGFPVEETKVVMYTDRPAKNTYSSGYAFHRAIGPSTRNILTFLQNEMRLLSECIPEQTLAVAVDDLEMANLKSRCKLNGWIEQGVLLLNMKFTPTFTNSTSLSDTIDLGWQIFTDFLISYLNAEYDHLVFLLIGSAVKGKKHLINSQMHMVMNLFHPAFYSHQLPHEQDPPFPYDSWEQWVPFLNANFYIYKKLGGLSAPLIDWNSVPEQKAGRIQRLRHLRFFFWRILDASNAQRHIEQRVSNDLVVVQVQPGYLTLKSWSMDEEEMDGVDFNKVKALKFEALT